MGLTRATLERWQVVVYAAAVGAGAGVGLGAPSVGAAASRGVWPLLGLLLFVTFLQLRLAGLGYAFRHRRYLGALLVGNFALVPLVVWGLSQLAPDESSVQLGFFVVMLAPCTDWVTTFTHLGRGDGRLALASTPLLLLVQMLLLPVLLWLFLGRDATQGMQAWPFLQAFALIILVPLLVALGVQRAAETRPRLAAARDKAAWLPVPLLALVLFAITASQIQELAGAGTDFVHIAVLYAAYLAIVPPLGVGISRLAGLSARPTRTLIFSLGTRNSFVVLPLVLAWPGAGALAASVVVIQSLVELCGMLVYLAILPRCARARGRR